MLFLDLSKDLFRVRVAKCVRHRSLISPSFSKKMLQNLEHLSHAELMLLSKGWLVKNLCCLESSFFDPYKNFTAHLHHDIFQGGLLKIMRTVKSILHNLVFNSGFII